MTDTEIPTTSDDLIAQVLSNQGAFNEKMGLEILEVSPDRVVARIPVEGNTQPYGLLHGGASMALAEALGSVGAALHGHPDKLAVGVDINATHHRSARSGWATGVATPAFKGRSFTTWDVVISDDRDKRLCTARITCALVSPEKLR